MTPQLICHHGHRLAAEEGTSSGQELICPLCGSLAELKRGGKTSNPEAFAVTHVPLSLAGPLPLGMAPLSDADSHSSSPVLPTTDFDPGDRDKGAEPEKALRSSRTNRESEPNDATGRTARKKQFEPPSLAGYEVMEELGRGAVTEWLDGKPLKRSIVVPGRLVNFVV